MTNLPRGVYLPRGVNLPLGKQGTIQLSGQIQQTTNRYFSHFPRKQDLTFHANCLQYFSYFPQKKKAFDISCKLSPSNTVYIKCQISFSGKNKKKIFQYENILVCRLLIIIPSMLSINTTKFRKEKKMLFVHYFSDSLIDIGIIGDLPFASKR